MKPKDNIKTANIKISKYILFLNNKYRTADNDFYLRILKGKIAIAVDGGIRFFIKNKICPDILIGDFDSSPRMSKKYLSNFEIINFPAEKNKTDSHLALETALERGATRIEICGGFSVSEIDHTLGNIFLLELVNEFQSKHGRKVSACLVSPSQKVYLMENDSITLFAQKGDYLSIIPLSDKVRLDFDGLKYPPPKKPIHLGNSLTLRNQFRRKKCRLSVGDGKALIVIVSK